MVLELSIAGLIGVMVGGSLGILHNNTTQAEKEELATKINIDQSNDLKVLRTKHSMLYLKYIDLENRNEELNKRNRELENLKVKTYPNTDRALEDSLHLKIRDLKTELYELKAFHSKSSIFN